MLPRSTSQFHHLLEDAIAHFRAHFQLAPQFAGLAPGRVNLIGEHTDYNDGYVLPIAINRSTVVIAGLSHQPFSTFIAHDLGEMEQLDIRGSATLQPKHRFSRYIIAVLEEFKAAYSEVPNLNVVIHGDIPRGSGLSSSASLEVAIASLMERMLPVSLTGVEKALLCQRAERNYVGVPCGIMDMFVISLAEPHQAMLLDCRTLNYDMVPCGTGDEFDLLIADTGVERSLTSGAYAERRTQCESAARKLGVRALRDIGPADLKRATTRLHLTGVELNRARHVVTENDRVLTAATRLRAHDLHALGDLMFQSHSSLRDDFEVSIAELDAVVAIAQDRRATHGDVFGARMTGAGFGGCAIVLCTVGSAAAVAETLEIGFRRSFGRAPVIFGVTATGGATSIQLE